MRLVLFAHTPPPHHGQSWMVQLMIEGFGGDRRAAPPPTSVRPHAPDDPDIRIYHVNARLSAALEDVGRMRWGKVWPLVGYCAQALWLRSRHRVPVLYYVPSPPKRSALYRDWLVMLLCRWWFRRVILHWHAVGLGEWLERQAHPWERKLTHLLLDRAHLAVVLARANEGDARRFRPRRVAIVANGIPDPCPQYDTRLRELRRRRAADRATALRGEPGLPNRPPASAEEPQVARVLFLAHCTRDKGLFDTLVGVRLAQADLCRRGVAVRLDLTVAGTFLSAEEQAAFEDQAAQPETAAWLHYRGFVSGTSKTDLFEQADLFCFPTYFANEGQPVNLIEAMAFGLPVVASRWRSIPEFLPADYPGLVEPRQPAAVAAALLALLAHDGASFRELFLERFTLDRHLASLAAALRQADPGSPIP